MFGSALEACRSYESAVDADDDCEVTTTIALPSARGNEQLFIMFRDWSATRSVELVVSESAGEFRCIGEIGWNSHSEVTTIVESVEHRLLGVDAPGPSAVLFQIVTLEEDASTEDIETTRTTSFVLCGPVADVPRCSEPRSTPPGRLEPPFQCLDSRVP